MLMSKTALPYSSLALTLDLFCCLGHAHALYHIDGKGNPLSC